LLLLTGVRTGELRRAEPSQFQLDQGLWVIPPTSVKQWQVELRRGTVAPQPGALSLQLLRARFTDEAPISYFITNSGQRRAQSSDVWLQLTFNPSQSRSFSPSLCE